MMTFILKSKFSSILTEGATLPAHLLCSAGFAGYAHSFTPHASHLHQICRMNISG